jgi:hypothetical protein
MIAPKKWMIPLILFFISSACGIIQTNIHARAVENLLNNAGRNGEPVIAVLADAYQSLPYNFKQVELRLYNIEGDFVRIAPAQTYNLTSFFGLLFFTIDGRLYQTIASDLDMGNDIYSMNLIDKSFTLQPYQLKNYIYPEQFFLSTFVDKSPDEIKVFSDYFTIIDHQNKTHEDFKYNEPGPWSEIENSTHMWNCAMANDHSKLFIGFHPRVFSGSERGMWVYDIHAGTWESLEIPDYLGFFFGVSVDGNSIIVMCHDSATGFYSSFINLENSRSNIIKSYVMPDIWQNWVAMEDDSGSVSKLKIFNIGNNWREYEIYLPPLSTLPGNIFQTYAIYEPPAPSSP